ncbi:hypothetical protein HO133_003890 [Letharia lupina]|uniref:Uncharacterized protein n=1 Tax=Letharia lupina TaxID=560253 RepID=A0A8H6F9C3_9LECA|nr:uncharacterized protein HO133_003890 [Letharia lupina]KAF6219424.1 hypothetical protein HO133_003890 [Letharia lupina]
MSSKTSGAELRARAVPKVGRKGELRVAKASGGGRTKERRTGMGRKQATESLFTMQTGKGSDTVTKKCHLGEDEHL